MTNVVVGAWSSWEGNPDWDSQPKLEFLPSLVKRRFSQLSRMALHVGHELLNSSPSGKINDLVFASRHGELKRQLDVSEALIENGELSPAMFSYSVFNAPAALLSLTNNIKGITRAVYDGSDSFGIGFLQSALLVSSGRVNRLLYVFGEEKTPEVYQGISGDLAAPFAVGFTLYKQDGCTDPLMEILLPGSFELQAASPADPRLFTAWVRESEGSTYDMNIQNQSVRFRRCR